MPRQADLVSSADEMQLLKEAVKSLNSAAQVHTSERGRVDLAQVLAAAQGGGIAEMDEDMEHRRMVEMVKAEAAAHGHAEHSHAQHAASTADPTAAPLDPAGANGHADHAGTKMECEQSGGGGAAGTAETSGSRESKRFGITSFCYQRRRPFHPHRLMSVIRELPVRTPRHLVPSLRQSPTEPQLGRPLHTVAASITHTHGYCLRHSLRCSHRHSLRCSHRHSLRYSLRCS